jgi:glycosyltransferase involved in cell wall biosynthesis
VAKISVIIPVFNTAEYLERCLQSVLAQSHFDLEVILIDDGSTDGSSQLCDQFAHTDQRVQVVHQANAGLSAARNVGLDRASGDYIGFVDSDDWIEPDMYSYLLDQLQQADADIAEIVLEVAMSASHQMRKTVEQLQVFTGEDILIHYFEHNEFGIWLRLYKRQVLADVRFDLGRINEDVVAGFLALSNAKRLVFSNQPKYYYFSNPIGISESPLRARDLDLLYAGDRLDDLTANTTNQHLRRLVLTKKYRSPFTLLVKMTLFGCNVELDEQQTRLQLRAQVREHYSFLMKSQMPLNRKILLTGCRFCYPLVKLAASVYRSLLHAKR